MAIITKEFRFEAAHQLPNHKGKCSRLHGHSYKAVITLRGGIQDPTTDDTDAGFVEDFDILSEAMKPLLDNYLDHYFLNDTLGIPRTTAEMIGVWLYGKLRDALGQDIFCVEIWETDKSYAAVTNGDWEKWAHVCLP